MCNKGPQCKGFCAMIFWQPWLISRWIFLLSFLSSFDNFFNLNLYLFLYHTARKSVFSQLIRQSGGYVLWICESSRWRFFCLMRHLNCNNRVVKVTCYKSSITYISLRFNFLFSRKTKFLNTELLSIATLYLLFISSLYELVIEAVAVT